MDPRRDWWAWSGPTTSEGPMHAQSLQLCDSFVTPWTAARQAPLSLGFPRQEYYSGLPFPPAADLPDPGFNLMSTALAGGFFTTEIKGKPAWIYSRTLKTF